VSGHVLGRKVDIVDGQKWWEASEKGRNTGKIDRIKNWVLGVLSLAQGLEGDTRWLFYSLP
jgi:hypothetical protein